MAGNNFSQALNIQGSLLSSSQKSSAETRSSQQKTSAGGKSSGAQDKILRYPLAKIDDSTDYLSITVSEFKPTGFAPTSAISLGEVKENEDQGNSVRNAEKNLSGLIGALPTISDRLTQRGPKGNVFSLKNSKYYITLPIPNNISDSNSVTWGEDSLNPLQATGINMVGEAAQSNPFEAIGGGFSELMDKVGAGVDANTQKAIVAAIAAYGVGSSPESLVTRATGQILNPNLELLFSGVNLRSFPFTFDFAPRSYDEAMMVKRIIRAFKSSIVPRTNRGKTIASGVFVSSPMIFQLEYKKGRQKHPFLNQFKPCALTDIQVNYTGSGTYATYHDGTPVHIQMSLTFKELNPVYAEDYDNIPLKDGVGF